MAWLTGVVTALPFYLPDMPEIVETILDTIQFYYFQGISVLTAFLGLPCIYTLKLLMILVLALEPVRLIWYLFMFIAKKIPFLNIH